MSMQQRKIESKIGPLYLVGSENGIAGVFWSDQSLPAGRGEVLLRAEIEISEYLAGKRKVFTLPLELKGSEFQRIVWRELEKIPYGQTISYGELARRVGKIGAARAVGSANGKNPICLIVPCHRVIAANGGFGGYSGGLEKKKFLLELERYPSSSSIL